jgi:hypothetical protein
MANQHEGKMLNTNWLFRDCRFFQIFCLVSFFSVIVITISSSTLFAQQNCESLLNDADKRFALGRFEEALKFADRCLQGGAPKVDQKIRIHELRGLAYVARDYPDSVKLQVHNLLTLNPLYAANPEEDPLLFREMIDQLRPQYLKRSRKTGWWIGGGAVTVAAAAIILRGKEKAPRLPDPPSFSENP